MINIGLASRQEAKARASSEFVQLIDLVCYLSLSCVMWLTVNFDLRFNLMKF